MTRLEPLEARIAPATILSGNKVLVYTDIDGDSVTITFSKPILGSAAVVFDTALNSPGPQQLRLLDLQEGTISDFDIKMTVKRGETGDGFADVGAILATGKDLGTVSIKGDLGRILAGDDVNNGYGVKALKVHSLGARGLETQAIGGTLTSNVRGGLDSLNVKTNFYGELKIVGITGNSATGELGKAVIGGSIVGGTNNSSGQIYTEGDIDSIVVKGNLEGGSGMSSGQISAGGGLASLVIGGSLLGRSGGGIDGDANTIHQGSGSVIVARQFDGDLEKAVIGGDLRGASGVGSGTIAAIGESTIGSITVKGSVVGGSGDYSGMIQSNVRLGKLVIGGSLIAKSGDYDFDENVRGQIYVNGPAGSITVKGDIIGGDGFSGGRIRATEDIGNVTIGGSMIAGAGQNTAAVQSLGDIGAVVIKRNVDGTLSAGGLATGIDAGGSVKSVKVGGFLTEASILSLQQIGAISIGAGVKEVFISAVGEAGATTKDVAIKSVKIGGSVRSTRILAGFDISMGTPWVNADAQIGPVNVGGDWIVSSISAGINPVDAFFGDMNDQLAAGDDQDITSRIASISIAGAVFGTPDLVSSTDSFGFVAQHIGAFKVGGVAFKLKPLGAGLDTINLSLLTEDVRLVEFPS